MFKSIIRNIKKLTGTLPTSMNVEKTLNEKSTSVNEPIPGTPFWIICQDNLWFITMKNYRLTEGVKTRKQAMRHLKDSQWLIIIYMVAIACKDIVKDTLAEERQEQLNKYVKKQENSIGGRQYEKSK